jgi:hypothetical protein
MRKEQHECCMYIAEFRVILVQFFGWAALERGGLPTA